MICSKLKFDVKIMNVIRQIYRKKIENSEIFCNYYFAK